MNKTCRVCLTSSHEVSYFSLLTIFPEFKRKSLCVLDLLSAVTSSQIELLDNLPSKICARCFKSLRSAYSFITIFNNSQKTLSENIEENAKFDFVVQKSGPLQKNIINRSLKHAGQQKDSDEERIIIITETENENDLENQLMGKTVEDNCTINGDDDDDDNVSDNVETETKGESATDDEISWDQFNDSSAEGSDVEDAEEEREKSADTDAMQEDMFNEDVDQEIMDMEENIFEETIPKTVRPLKHEEPELVKCKVCGKMFSGVAGSIARRNLLRHIQDEHQNELLTYECEFCDKVYTGFNANRALQRLIKHKNKEHSLEELAISKTMVEDSVGEKVEIKEEGVEIKEENLLKEEDETNKGPPEIFGCDLCGKYFHSRKNLWHHRYKCNNLVEKNECDVCNEVFKNKNALRYHKVAKHLGKRFPCSICHKKFFSPSLLRVHVNAVHEKARPVKYLCSICGRGFKYTTALKYHLSKEHTNQKDHVCDYCGAAFILLGALRTHERNHTGERPYVCKFCKKGFKRSTEKNRHERIHLGIYPHSCEYCQGKVFPSKYNMKVHWLQHGGDFNCSICPKGFLTQEILEFHYSHRHKIKDPNNL